MLCRQLSSGVVGGKYRSRYFHRRENNLALSQRLSSFEGAVFIKVDYVWRFLTGFRQDAGQGPNDRDEKSNF